MTEPLSDERLAEIRDRNALYRGALRCKGCLDLLDEVDRLRAENAALRGQVEKLIVYLDEAEQERDSLLGESGLTPSPPSST